MTVADPNTQTKPAAAGGRKSMRVDLVNNLRCARYINTGLGPEHVAVQPGETKRNVELSETVVRELKSRARSKQGEVQVYGAGQAPDPSKVAPDADEDPDTDDE